MASYLRGQVLTPEQVAQHAYAAGFRGDDLAHITGLITQREAGNESTGFNAYAGAHRTDTNNYASSSGDHGLAQVNWDAWGQQLIQAGIIRTHTDLYDAATNLRAAKFILDRQGWAAWGAGPGGWKAGGDSWYGVNNRGAAEAAVQRAMSQGMVASDAGAPAATAGGGGGGGASGSVTLPRGVADVVRIGGAVHVLYEIAPGVLVRYDWQDGQQVNTQGAGGPTLTQQQFDDRYRGRTVVYGGNVAELGEVNAAFGTYQAFTTAIWDQLFPAGDPRRNDPEIMAVVAQRAGRPDMTEAEFENLLKGTQYYQTRTEGQLRWNDISQAERNQQTQEMASRMAQTYQQFAGGTIDVSDKWIAHYAEQVASGVLAFGQWTETVLKPAAAQNSESPWSRQLRDETESQRQRPIDLENTSLRVRDTLTRWGIQWSEPSIQAWARGLVEKTHSDEDLVNTLKQSAMVLYPWKDPDMETVVAAAPWIETYNRVMERQGSLQSSEIARVLSAYGRDPDNNDPWSFEQHLKMSDQYDQTRQGQDDAWSTTAELAGMMGF